MFDIQTGRPPMGYGRGYYPPAPRGPGGQSYYGGNGNTYYGSNGNDVSKIEGGSRRTFDTTYSDSMQVELETDGRPLNAKVEVWEGPDNTPASMTLWSEDGRAWKWEQVGFANFKANNGGYGGSVGNSLTIDNTGSSEFPIYASAIVGGRMMGTSRRQTMRIEGNGAQESFTVSGPCIVEVWSQGFPYYANVQVWDGPNNVKQSAEVYSDDGSARPWTAVIDPPSSGSTIQIKNPGPLEYPLYVSIEQLGGGGGGGGYY
eukprot:Sro903_g218190.1 n/a (259) ;mRNA; r:3905-4681